LKQPPHTLISSGTLPEGYRESPLYKHVSKLVKPVFEDVAHETSNNRMSVGSGRSKVASSVYYQPHNYKLYFQYSRPTRVFPPSDSELNDLYTRGRLPRSRVFKLINHGKELCFPDWSGCRVVVHKKTIEITNKIDHKRWFPIPLSDADLIEARFQEIADLKDSECLRVLREFIGVFGGSSSEVIVNSHVEAKVAGEDKIDLIPAKMRFHGDVAKKVYDEKNVEFKTAAHACDYLTSRTKEGFLEERFESLRKELMSSKPLVSSLESVKMSIVSFPFDVFAQEKEISSLSDDDKFSLSIWLFDTFGVSS